MILTFDAESHVYYGDGVKIPGVTEVLTRTGICEYPDIQRMRDARLRGSRVHMAVELYEKGTLDEDGLRDNPEMAAQNINGYLDAYKKFKDEHIAKVVAYELIVGHQIFRYGGKLDQISITRDARLVVWDWKTGQLPWWVKIQTGAYLEAILSMKELDSDDLWHGAVALRPDGSYSEPRLSQDRSPFSVFRQALNVVNYTDRKGA